MQACMLAGILIYIHTNGRMDRERQTDTHYIHTHIVAHKQKYTYYIHACMYAHPHACTHMHVCTHASMHTHRAFKS